VSLDKITMLTISFPGCPRWQPGSLIDQRWEVFGEVEELFGEQLVLLRQLLRNKVQILATLLGIANKFIQLILYMAHEVNLRELVSKTDQIFFIRLFSLVKVLHIEASE